MGNIRLWTLGEDNYLRGNYKELDIDKIILKLGLKKGGLWTEDGGFK